MSAIYFSLVLAVPQILVKISFLIIKTANLQLCGDCVTRMIGKFSSTMDTKPDRNYLNNIIATLSVSFFGIKRSRADAIKVSTAINRKRQISRPIVAVTYEH